MASEKGRNPIWLRELERYHEDLESQKASEVEDTRPVLPGVAPRAARRKRMREIIDPLRPEDKALAHSTPWYQGRHPRGSKTKRIEMVIEPSADNPGIPVVVDIKVKPAPQQDPLKPRPRVDDLRAAEALALDAEEITTRETFDGVYHFSGSPYPEEPANSLERVEGHDLAPVESHGGQQLTLGGSAVYAAATRILEHGQRSAEGQVVSPILASCGIHVVDLGSWREDDRRMQDISELLTQF